MSVAGFHAEVRALHLERVLSGSVKKISKRGWNGLSMTVVAQRSGVWRQRLSRVWATGTL